jgi:hypothetical protein
VLPQQVYQQFLSTTLPLRIVHSSYQMDLKPDMEVLTRIGIVDSFNPYNMTWRYKWDYE